jgi:hypothetical protein
MYTDVLTLPTAMPEYSAAVSLPPTAYTDRPHWNPFMRNWNPMPSAIITAGAIQATGIPMGFHPGGRRPDTSKNRPSVTMNATPRAMPITPRVPMNGGSPTSTTSPAVTAPAMIPTPRPAARLRPSEWPPSTNSFPATTPASAMTAPGERSTPPEMITMAAPTAAMPYTDEYFRMSSPLAPLRKG